MYVYINMSKLYLNPLFIPFQPWTACKCWQGFSPLCPKHTFNSSNMLFPANVTPSSAMIRSPGAICFGWDWFQSAISPSGRTESMMMPAEAALYFIFKPRDPCFFKLTWNGFSAQREFAVWFYTSTLHLKFSPLYYLSISILYDCIWLYSTLKVPGLLEQRRFNPRTKLKTVEHIRNHPKSILVG